jgi:hypothetical protein
VWSSAHACAMKESGSSASVRGSCRCIPVFGISCLFVDQKLSGARSKRCYPPTQECGSKGPVSSVRQTFREVAIICLNGKDTNMRNRWSLVLCIAAFTLSTSRGNAGPCTREIDREWAEVGAKLQARIGAGRSNVQGAVGLLHHQPTPGSVAGAQEKVGDMWVPLETAVIALARAREADHANDTGTCKQALLAAQRAFLR